MLMTSTRSWIARSIAARIALSVKKPVALSPARYETIVARGATPTTPTPLIGAAITLAAATPWPWSSPAMSSVGLQPGERKQALRSVSYADPMSGCVKSAPLSITATVTPRPAGAPLSIAMLWFASHTSLAPTSLTPQGMNSGDP